MVFGLPPLNWGMGEGEWAGEATRGLGVCAFRFAPWGWLGVAWEGAGEPPIAPNCRLGAPLVAGPPFGSPPGAVALMVTEDLRVWSEAMLLLLAMAGAMLGSAGWMRFLPFTGDTDELLPC
jgi:hypothetical protein